jgi:hypothetical protein
MEGNETPRTASKLVFWIPIAFALTFGVGLCAGTIAAVKADVAKALIEQERRFERKVEQAVGQKGAEMRRAFKTRRGAE